MINKLNNVDWQIDLEEMQFYHNWVYSLGTGSQAKYRVKKKEKKKKKKKRKEKKKNSEQSELSTT